ncbi:hypothetical protein EYF80_040757 [Liparis tanakae]|uniref:Uncharacterized protein n=1 Tax=Liparis tanakae TaxID=230148 RepID=A0A4Z2G6B2_9TELE|nr:hypothetical protein EYF80_040757 [Liparis tanakae]
MRDNQVSLEVKYFPPSYERRPAEESTETQRDQKQKPCYGARRQCPSSSPFMSNIGQTTSHPKRKGNRLGIDSHHHPNLNPKLDGRQLSELLEGSLTAITRSVKVNQIGNAFQTSFLCN